MFLEALKRLIEKLPTALGGFIVILMLLVGAYTGYLAFITGDAGHERLSVMESHCNYVLDLLPRSWFGVTACRLGWASSPPSKPIFSPASVDPASSPTPIIREMPGNRSYNLFVAYQPAAAEARASEITNALRLRRIAGLTVYRAEQRDIEQTNAVVFYHAEDREASEALATAVGGGFTALDRTSLTNRPPLGYLTLWVTN